MQRRTFGSSETRVSTLTFGSMRMDARHSDRELDDVLTVLADDGVDTFHSSHEYDTHPRFCQALARLRRARPQLRPVHVVKLAAPHFGEDDFDAARFEGLVDAQRLALDTDRLDVVQWLARSQPISDALRLPLLGRMKDRFLEAWERMRTAGKVGELASFPYSLPFMHAALEWPGMRGLVSYLGVAERELVPHLDAMHGRGQGVMALRPLLAGRVLGAGDPLDAHLTTRLAELASSHRHGLVGLALEMPLLHPSVSTIILSVSTLEHARIALAATANVTPSAPDFHALVARLEGTT